MARFCRPILALALLASLAATRAPRAIAAVSRNSDSAQIFISGDTPDESAACDPGGDGRSRRAAPGFLLFNPRPFNESCSGESGQVTLQASQDTSFKGAASDLDGLTSHASASAHARRNSDTTVDPDIFAESEADLTVHVNVTGSPVKYHLDGSIDVSTAGSASPRACVHLLWDGHTPTVAQNPDGVSGPCLPETAGASRQLDLDGTLQPGTHELSISELAQAGDFNTPASASGTASADWDLDLAFCTIVVSHDVTEGTPGDDVICGSEDDDVIDGLGGNDTILGRGGEDTINGGAGNDSIEGGDAIDHIRGGAGDDDISGGPGADDLDGDDDIDTILGDAGNDLIHGNDGGDLINGGPGDELFGSNDPGIEGGAGPDLIFGATGDDFIQGDEGSDAILGNDGSDKLRGIGGDDCLDGGPRKDVLLGGPDDDRLNSRDGIRDEVHGNGGHHDKAQIDRHDSVDGVENEHASVGCVG
jgi:Ca2+-binding RTX toxin-like protein